MTAELELLLLCLRGYVGTADPAGTSPRVDDGFDWKHFVAACRWHGVQGLVCEVLDDMSLWPPCPVSAELTQSARQLAAANLQLIPALHELAAVLRLDGAPFAIFKGLPLTVSLYRSLSHRRSKDIDLLVRSDDADRVMTLLRGELGYRLVEEVPDWQEEWLLRSRTDLPLINEDGVVVELHSSLDIGRSREVLAYENQLLERAVPVPIGGTVIPTPTPTALLPYLAVHGTQHRWFRLFWLVDIALLARRLTGTDWHQVVDTASAIGHSRALGLALELSATLLGVDPPEVTRSKLGHDPRVSWMANAVVETLSRDPGSEEPGPAGHRARHLRWQLLTRPRAADKIGLLWNYFTAVQPQDLAAVSLPPRLGFGYHLVRPLRLVCRLTSELVEALKPTIGRPLS